jgi:hypothetical protein
MQYAQAIGTPNGLYAAQWTKKEDHSWIDGAISIDKASQCWTLHDLTHISSPLRDHIDIATVRSVPWTEAIADTQLQSYVFELLYRTLRAHMRGLPITFDKARTRYYFLPKEGQARTWRYQSLRRKAERKVAHPFSGKYWAHHAAKFTWEFHGNRLFLKIVPAYVFTENGSTVQADEDVIRLNVKKRKREYNRQVFQHLIFWREILAKDGTQIRLTTGTDQALLIDKNFVCQQVTFGIYDDKQSFSTITKPMEEAIDESAFLSESEDALTSDEDAYDQSDEAEDDG